MAYDLKLPVIAFQWKGERSDEMEQFSKIFSEVSFTRTGQHILRAKFNNTCVEVPCGNYLIVPERQYQNRFSMTQKKFVLNSKETGGLQYDLTLENIQVLFYQDILNINLEAILKEKDKHAFVELEKFRYFSENRYVSMAKPMAMILGPDYSFTVYADYLKQICQEHKLQFRDKRVVIDDASVIVIRTDATVIVDAQKKCSIYRKCLTNLDQTDVMTGIEASNRFGTENVNPEFRFSAKSNEDANSISLKFLLAHEQDIGAAMTLENQKCMLAYILDSLSTMIRKASLCPERQLIISMRINRFNFKAIYDYYQGTIILSE